MKLLINDIKSSPSELTAEILSDGWSYISDIHFL